MCSIVKPSDSKFLYLVKIETDKATYRIVYETDSCFSDFYKTDLEVIKDNKFVRSITVFDLDNNYEIIAMKFDAD